MGRQQRVLICPVGILNRIRAKIALGFNYFVLICSANNGIYIENSYNYQLRMKATVYGLDTVVARWLTI